MRSSSTRSPSRARASAVLLLLASVAFAPRAAADSKEADQLFLEAEQLTKSGQLREACKKLEASMNIDPAPGTQFRLGECYEQLGRMVDASRLLRELERAMSVRGDDARAKKAGDRAAQIETRTPRIKLDMPWAKSVSGLVVELDGAGLVAWDAPLRVDPGGHAIVVRAPDRVPFQTTVKATEGEETPLAIPELARVPQTATPSTTAPGAAAAPAPASTWPWQKTAALASGGVGVVALAVGGVLVLGAKGDYDTATEGCAPSGCPRAKATEANDARDRANVGGIVGVAGLALVGAGAVLWLTAPSSGARNVGLSLEPRGGGSVARVNIRF